MNAFSNLEEFDGPPEQHILDKVEDGICLPALPSDHSTLDKGGNDPISALVRLLARQLAEERINGTGQTDTTRNSK